MNENSIPPKKNFTRIEATLTPDIKATLKRYLEIQREDHELQEEKAQLQKLITEYLSKSPEGFWFPVVDGTELKVRYARDTEIEYDENLLRSRLGEKYKCLLKPDLRKIRQHLPELEEILSPVLDMVGTPDRDKVKAAIDSGDVSRETFSGAFRKETKTRLAVMKFQPEGT
jgi:hypothetical protein